MAKSKTHKDEEELRGRIRELEKANRALKRRLRQLEKKRHIWEELQLDEEEVEPIVETKSNSCPHCNNGHLIYLDLGIKFLVTCSTCLYRKTENK